MQDKAGWRQQVRHNRTLRICRVRRGALHINDEDTRTRGQQQPTRTHYDAVLQKLDNAITQLNRGEVADTRVLTQR